MGKANQLFQDQQTARWQEAFDDYAARWQEAFDDYVLENFGGRDVTGREYDEACDYANQEVEAEDDNA